MKSSIRFTLAAGSILLATGCTIKSIPPVEHAAHAAPQPPAQCILLGDVTAREGVPTSPFDNTPRAPRDDLKHQAADMGGDYVWYTGETRAQVYRCGDPVVRTPQVERETTPPRETVQAPPSSEVQSTEPRPDTRTVVHTHEHRTFYRTLPVPAERTLTQPVVVPHYNVRVGTPAEVGDRRLQRPPQGQDHNRRPYPPRYGDRTVSTPDSTETEGSREANDRRLDPPGHRERTVEAPDNTATDTNRRARPPGKREANDRRLNPPGQRRSVEAPDNTETVNNRRAGPPHGRPGDNRRLNPPGHRDRSVEAPGNNEAKAHRRVSPPAHGQRTPPVARRGNRSVTPPQGRASHRITAEERDERTPTPRTTAPTQRRQPPKAVSPRGNAQTSRPTPSTRERSNARTVEPRESTQTSRPTPSTRGRSNTRTVAPRENVQTSRPAAPTGRSQNSRANREEASRDAGVTRSEEATANNRRGNARGESSNNRRGNRR